MPILFVLIGLAAGAVGAMIIAPSKPNTPVWRESTRTSLQALQGIAARLQAAGVRTEIIKGSDGLHYLMIPSDLESGRIAAQLLGPREIVLALGGD